MKAISAEGESPIIDGVLDEKIWLGAPVATDFIQKDPTIGEPATEKTTVQVVYDDKALYIGLQCFDSEADKVVPRLSRRDYSIERNQISVMIDPHHDHQTGFYFIAGPSGWIADGILFNDASQDQAWDGVWEARTSVHDEGWTVEFRIPFHVLRFKATEGEQTWGFNVHRWIDRKYEWDYWVLIPYEVQADVTVSWFGHLEGIEGVEPPAHLEVLPFSVGRSSFVPKSAVEPDGRDLFSTMGFDLRYGLTPNISVNATVNPDFGQVESDPAVLNLSVFETFFEERRPFFLEGSSIFETPGSGISSTDFSTKLFHSRRIGRLPSRFSPPSGSSVLDSPDRTTIIGALKVSGKTAGNISFGLLNAVADEEFGSAGTSLANATRFRLEPYTNYLVGRAQYDVMTHSTVGATLTAVNGQGFPSAYVGSADADLKWRQSMYRVYTRMSGSRTGPDGDRSNGYETVAFFTKNFGTYRGRIYADARSRGFDVNDLGFMSRNNRIQTGARGGYQRDQPWRWARRSRLRTNFWSHWNFDDVNLKRGINVESSHLLHNFWWIWAGVGREFEATSDLETRGGPLIARPGSTNYWIGFVTDQRNRADVEIGFNGDRGHEGRNDRKRIGITPSFRPIPNLQLSFAPAYQKERKFAQWIDNVDDDGDGTADHIVFGELDNDLFDITTRVTMTFRTNLSVQLFMQPFVTVGDYGAIKELARPESYEFTTYDDLGYNPDFSFRSLRSNLVLRWEYRLGSTLFFVWSQSRSRSLDIDDPSFDAWNGLGNSFTDEGDNVFLVKLNYWVGG